MLDQVLLLLQACEFYNITKGEILIENLVNLIIYNRNYVRDNVLSKTLQLELHEKNVGKYPVKQQQQKRKIKATAAISIKTNKTKRKNTTYFKIY